MTDILEQVGLSSAERTALIHMVLAVERAIDAERERCAKLVENYDADDPAVSGRDILAAAIRGGF